MKNWKSTLISRAAPIRKAIEVIDSSGTQICLVIDDQSCLLGTITDGDVRRGLLCGIGLDETVDKIMYTHPATAVLTDTDEFLLHLMDSRQIHQVPILDEARRVVGLRLRDGLGQVQPHSNPVVLMAGGLGSRLRPLTEDRPKPLLQIGSKPIIETIIDGYFEQGFRSFYITLNYKAEMIAKHLGDGSRWGVTIHYVREQEALGTAGSLSLLPPLGDEPLLVMNGDILTRVNYEQLLLFHQDAGAAATMCVREYAQQVPYGVIETRDNLITTISEKPVHRYHVNAGIYVLNEAVLKHLPHNRYLDMPELLLKLIAAGEKVAAFPVREYWIDIGQMRDYHRANEEYDDHF